MGAVYVEQSKYAEALRKYEPALDIKTATLGKDRPNVADVRRNMGIVYQQQSKYAEALRKYEPALDMKTATLGKDRKDGQT